MTQNGKIDTEWLLLTLNDAAEELAHATAAAMAATVIADSRTAGSGRSFFRRITSPPRGWRRAPHWASCRRIF